MLLTKTLTFESVRGKYLLQDWSCTFASQWVVVLNFSGDFYFQLPWLFFPRLPVGRNLLLIFVCHSMHNLWLSKPAARVLAGTWQLSLLRGSSQALKRG